MEVRWRSLIHVNIYVDEWLVIPGATPEQVFAALGLRGPTVEIVVSDTLEHPAEAKGGQAYFATRCADRTWVFVTVQRGFAAVTVDEALLSSLSLQFGAVTGVLYDSKHYHWQLMHFVSGALERALGFGEIERNEGSGDSLSGVVIPEADQYDESQFERVLRERGVHWELLGQSVRFIRATTTPDRAPQPPGVLARVRAWLRKKKPLCASAPRS